MEVLLGPLAQELATSRSLSPESVKKLDDLLAEGRPTHQIDQDLAAGRDAGLLN